MFIVLFFLFLYTLSKPFDPKDLEYDDEEECFKICEMTVSNITANSVLYTYTSQVVQTELTNEIFYSYLEGVMSTKVLNDVLQSRVVKPIKTEIIGVMKTDVSFDPEMLTNITTLISERVMEDFSDMIKDGVIIFLVIEVLVVFSISVTQLLICLMLCRGYVKPQKELTIQ